MCFQTRGVHSTPVWGGASKTGWISTPFENGRGGALHPGAPPQSGVEQGWQTGWSGVEHIFQNFGVLHPSLGWSMGWERCHTFAPQAKKYIFGRSSGWGRWIFCVTGSCVIPFRRPLVGVSHQESKIGRNCARILKFGRKVQQTYRSSLCHLSQIHPNPVSRGLENPILGEKCSQPVDPCKNLGEIRLSTPTSDFACRITQFIQHPSTVGNSE